MQHFVRPGGGNRRPEQPRTTSDLPVLERVRLGKHMHVMLNVVKKFMSADRANADEWRVGLSVLQGGRKSDSNRADDVWRGTGVPWAERVNEMHTVLQFRKRALGELALLGADCTSLCDVAYQRTRAAD